MLDTGALVEILIMLLLAAIMWKLRKLDQLVVDVAVIKRDIENVGPDHDKLVVLETRVEKNGKDLNNAHEKIRSISDG